MGATMANLQEQRQHRRRDRNHAECGHLHRKDDVGAGRSALPRVDERRPTDPRQIPREHQPHWLPRGAFDSRLHITLAPSTKLPTISIATTMAAYRRFIGQILRRLVDRRPRVRLPCTDVIDATRADGPGASSRHRNAYILC